MFSKSLNYLKRLFQSKEYQKVEKMSIKEYNAYIKEKDKLEFYAARDHIKNILPIAHQDYIKSCKRGGYSISDTFIIKNGDYGITYGEILSFSNEPEMSLGNYHVEFNRSTYDYLEIFLGVKYLGDKE